MQQHTIMIVDDSDDTREIFQATLETEGYKVLGAKDGLEALDMLEDHKDISLVLLDLAMPGMTGIELLEAMQQRNLAQNVPIIFVSAANNLEQIARPANVVDVLKKPFFYPELIHKIKVKHGFKANKKISGSPEQNKAATPEPPVPTSKW
ncbi:MAG TPA: response regulator [Bdellovibrionales bacterium]|nr:response regulator [Bdellovibrionales bacterium]